MKHFKLLNSCCWRGNNSTWRFAVQLWASLHSFSPLVFSIMSGGVRGKRSNAVQKITQHAALLQVTAEGKKTADSWATLSCGTACSPGRLWKIGFITCELSDPHGWELPENDEGLFDETGQHRQSPDASTRPPSLTFARILVTLRHLITQKAVVLGEECFPSLWWTVQVRPFACLNFGPWWSGCDWRVCATPGLCHLLKKADCKATWHKPCSCNHARIMGSRWLFTVNWMFSFPFRSLGVKSWNWKLISKWCFSLTMKQLKEEKFKTLKYHFMESNQPDATL